MSPIPIMPMEAFSLERTILAKDNSKSETRVSVSGEFYTMATFIEGDFLY
jgi:hypothetical protein